MHPITKSPYSGFQEGECTDSGLPEERMTISPADVESCEVWRLKAIARAKIRRVCEVDDEEEALGSGPVGLFTHVYTHAYPRAHTHTHTCSCPAHCTLHISIIHPS